MQASTRLVVARGGQCLAVIAVLFLSVAAACAAPEDSRFVGGAYDGWAVQEMPYYMRLTSMAPAKLGFVQEPGGGEVGQVWDRQPAVMVQDEDGYAVAGVEQEVTLAIANNPAGGTLGGTVTVAVDTGTGVATFSGLSIDKVGTGYTLTATGDTLSATPGEVVSAAFDVARPLSFRFRGGSFDGWDRAASAGYTPVARLTGAVLTVR